VLFWIWRTIYASRHFLLYKPRPTQGGVFLLRIKYCILKDSTEVLGTKKQKTVPRLFSIFFATYRPSWSWADSPLPWIFQNTILDLSSTSSLVLRICRAWWLHQQPSGFTQEIVKQILRIIHSFGCREFEFVYESSLFLKELGSKVNEPGSKSHKKFNRLGGIGTRASTAVNLLFKFHLFGCRY